MMSCGSEPAELGGRTHLRLSGADVTHTQACRHTHTPLDTHTHPGPWGPFSLSLTSEAAGRCGSISNQKRGGRVAEGDTMQGPSPDCSAVNLKGPASEVARCGAE